MVESLEYSSQSGLSLDVVMGLMRVRAEIHKLAKKRGYRISICFLKSKTKTIPLHIPFIGFSVNFYSPDMKG